MGCTQMKQQKSKEQTNPQILTVRQCLRQLDDIIRQIEELNCKYLKHNKVDYKIDTGIEKIEEFVKIAHQNSKSESFVTIDTQQPLHQHNQQNQQNQKNQQNKQNEDNHQQIIFKFNYDEYATELTKIQKSSQPIVIKGFELYQQKSTIDRSLIITSLLQKLVLLQNFSLKFKIPLMNSELQKAQIEQKLQFIVKQLSCSQFDFPAS